MALVNKTFSDIITFTRASTATFFNSAGVLTSAATNAPRFDYNPSTLAAQGLLIEESRTNSYTQSGSVVTGVGNWLIARATSVANAVIAPDNTLSGSKLQEDTTAANSHYIYAASPSYTSGTTYTQSIFVKAAGRTQIQMSFPSGAFTTELRVLYDLTTVTATVQTGTPTGTITSVGNGWYRCTITATATATASANTIAVYLFNGSLSYNGDGTSGVYVWGAQLEAGAFPTSYIPTTTTALTRAADVASVNTLSPWYNASAGAIYFEGVTFDTTPGIFPNAAMFTDGTANNRSGIVRNNSTGNARSNVVVGGAAQFAADATAWTLNATAKIALAYAVNDFALVVNGGAATTDTLGTIPAVDRLRLGVDSVGSNAFLNGYLRRVVFYPRRLSNAELVSITS